MHKIIRTFCDISLCSIKTVPVNVCASLMQKMSLPDSWSGITLVSNSVCIGLFLNTSVCGGGEKLL